MTTPLQSTTKLSLINRARHLLLGKWSDSNELKELYEELEKWDQYAYATDVLLAKMKLDEKEGHPVSLKEHQQLAKFIYKDHSLPSSFKFDKALQQLNAHDELSKTERCETLGLAGAIYKYKWLYDHQTSNLEFAKHYYQRGTESWEKFIKLGPNERTSSAALNDYGYAAINYACVVELTALDRLEREGEIIDLTGWLAKQLEEAKALRLFIKDQFVDGDKLVNPNAENWVIATVAETLFGLGEYEMALPFIKLYKRHEDENWKVRTTSRQLLSIAYVQRALHGWLLHSEQKKTKMNAGFRFDEAKVNECISVLLAENAMEGGSIVGINQEGKVGLALSGGGFRAALFHIGTLAALAEQDKLKDIEVISCVSGGSIIGAFYYLKLRDVLERKSDQDIQREDYIKIIQEVESEFLAGVQQNLRMRVLSNLICNVKMLFGRGYSRTHRLGELYEEYLYAPLLRKKKGEPVFINELRVLPMGDPDFSIGMDNWKRINKIPQLILNATSMNTGHNWQFAATWMGEPPGSIQADIDVKPRLRRMYYDDAPPRYKKFRLGYAVGASSCVPAMFTPMPMKDLYPGIDLQLVDGGLHDNQGIAALIEQECKNMIISDASGQMPTTMDSEKNELEVFFRADTVLQERLRELQFKDLKERKYSTQLNSLLSVHLKSDLRQAPVSWQDCNDPPRAIYEEATQQTPNAVTKYGILKNVQTLLSEVRTDLDSFHDAEAYALMYSGYSQTNYELDFRKEKEFESNTNWKFLSIGNAMREPAESRSLERLLRASRKVPFKLIELFPSLRYARNIVFTTALLLLANWLLTNWWGAIDLGSISVQAIAWTILPLLAGLVLSKSLAAWLNPKALFRKKLMLGAALLGMWIVSNVYLAIFNGWYNRAGRLKTP